MPMADTPMAVKATESAESEQASTEVMMAPAAVRMAAVPEAPKVDLINQRRGFYLGGRASKGSRCRRTRNDAQPNRASDSSED
jgi:hypothetical protein